MTLLPGKCLMAIPLSDPAIMKQHRMSAGSAPRDIVSTTCPGDLLYTYVGTDFYNAESRTEVNDRINGITHPTDLVRIIKAEFIAKSRTLTVEVLSNKQPDAVITLQGIGVVPFVLLDQKYTYQKSRTTNPGTVNVTSSLGGSATATVIVK